MKRMIVMVAGVLATLALCGAVRAETKVQAPSVYKPAWDQAVTYVQTNGIFAAFRLADGSNLDLTCTRKLTGHLNFDTPKNINHMAPGIAADDSATYGQVVAVSNLLGAGSGYATNSGFAIVAGSSTNAQNSGYATNSGFAIVAGSSTNAQNSGYATNAGFSLMSAGSSNLVTYNSGFTQAVQYASSGANTNLSSLTMYDANNTNCFAQLSRAHNQNTFTMLNKVVAPVATSYAASYNGTDSQYGSLDSITPLNGATNCTYSFWYYVRSGGFFTQYSGIIVASSAVSYRNGFINWGSRGSLDFGGAKNGAGLWEIIVTNGVPVDTWTHVAGTWDGATAIIYTNGILASQGATGAGTLSLSAAGFNLGYDSRRAGGYLNGALDEVALWDVCLPSNRVYELAQSRYITTNQTFLDGTSMGYGLKELHHFDENTGVTLADASGNGNTGNLGTGTWASGVALSQGQIPAQIIRSSDGINAGEQGIHTLGTPEGRVVLEGKTTRFNVAGVEKFSISDDVLLPSTDNALDLGSGTYRYKNLYTMKHYLHYQDTTNYVYFSADAYNSYFTRMSNGVENIKTNSLYP